MTCRSHTPYRRHNYTLARRWQPLTDAEWDALLPFALVREGPGRPLRDARRRMDAVFWIAASGSAWHTVPPRFGKADTIGRHFRRLSHTGLWERLLRALARPDAPPALLALEHWIVCACRRATRIRGLRIIVLARRLLFRSALRAPSWLLPDPDLSEWLHRRVSEVLERASREGARAVPPGFFGASPRSWAPPRGAGASRATWNRSERGDAMHAATPPGPAPAPRTSHARPGDQKSGRATGQRYRRKAPDPTCTLTRRSRERMASRLIGAESGGAPRRGPPSPASGRTGR